MLVTLFHGLILEFDVGSLLLDLPASGVSLSIFTLLINTHTQLLAALGYTSTTAPREAFLCVERLEASVRFRFLMRLLYAALC